MPSLRNSRRSRASYLAISQAATAGRYFMVHRCLCRRCSQLPSSGSAATSLPVNRPCRSPNHDIPRCRSNERLKHTYSLYSTDRDPRAEFGFEARTRVLPDILPCNTRCQRPYALTTRGGVNQAHYNLGRNSNIPSKKKL